jgi:hypothetical protein
LKAQRRSLKVQEDLGDVLALEVSACRLQIRGTFRLRSRQAEFRRSRWNWKFLRAWGLDLRESLRDAVLVDGGIGGLSFRVFVRYAEGQFR